MLTQWFGQDTNWQLDQIACRKRCFRNKEWAYLYLVFWRIPKRFFWKCFQHKHWPRGSFFYKQGKAKKLCQDSGSSRVHSRQSCSMRNTTPLTQISIGAPKGCTASPPPSCPTPAPGAAEHTVSVIPLLVWVVVVGDCSWPISNRWLLGQPFTFRGGGRRIKIGGSQNVPFEF